MNAAESNYRAWLSKAENDLLNIENNLQAERTPWDTVCFHAQQVAEKSLKAFLVYHEQKPKRTHDLSVLVTRCAEFDDALHELEADVEPLVYHAVEARYPGVRYDPDETEGRQMVAIARRVRARILALLPDAA